MSIEFPVDRPIRNEYGKIEFQVSGLEIMKGSTDKAKVVYAKIQSESLQKIADSITTAFVDAGKCNININIIWRLDNWWCLSQL